MLCCVWVCASSICVFCFFCLFCVFFFFYGYGDHRDLHRVDRRQRQMCIRDRLLTEDPDILCLQETKAAPEQLSEELLNINGYKSYFSSSVVKKGYSGVAVSYTHLRAHETPEHLVCRLLLEKKKKKKQHTDDTCK